MLLNDCQSEARLELFSGGHFDVMEGGKVSRALCPRF